MNCIFRPLEKESLWALKAPFGEYLPGETCVSAVAVHLRSLSFHRNLLRTSACCDLCRVPPCHSDVKVFSSSVVGLFSTSTSSQQGELCAGQWPCFRGRLVLCSSGGGWNTARTLPLPLLQKEQGLHGTGLTFGRLTLVLECRWDELHGAFLVSCFSNAAVAVAPCSSCAERGQQVTVRSLKLRASLFKREHQGL